MSFALRPRRLAAYVAAMVLPLVLTYATIQVGTAIYVRSIEIDRERQWNAGLSQQIAVANTQLASILQVQYLSEAQRHRMIEAIKARIERLQMDLQQPTIAARPSYVRAALAALLMPLSQRSDHVTHYGRVPVASAAPKQIHTVALFSLRAQFGIRGFGNRREALESAELIGFGWISLTGVLLLMAPLFLFLPTSLRQARVRRRHLVRVLAYGMWIPMATGLGLALSLLAGVVDNAWWRWIQIIAWSLPTWLYALLIVCWWSAAAGNYLRLRHATAVAVLLSTLAALLMLAVHMVCWRQYMANLLI